MKWIQKTAAPSRGSDIIGLVISIAIAVVAMVLLSLLYLKIDLTAEKRHTLTPGTIKLLSELDDHMYVRCYLHGEFPAEFKKLEQSIQERLEEFNDYSNGLIDYEFIDPYAEGDPSQVEANVTALLEKGLRYTNIKMQENGAQLEKRIFPGIIVEYKGMEYPIALFRADKPIVSPTDLTNAIQGSLNQLEYQLANGLKKISRAEKPAIAVLTGHGEIDRLNLADFIFSLSENYAVEQVKLDERLNALNDKVEGVSYRKNRYAALVIAGTDTMVSDKDRFIIDQFVMNGGKVLWMLDALKMNLDSLAMAQTSTAVENLTGLSPMLYQYGVRLNNTMVADYES
ncbi:MAG: Gldg family protein, partial [Flavobacteriales bacterium]